MTAPSSLIQETNIEHILQEHLPEEVRLLDIKIRELRDKMEELQARKTRLCKIAEAAELSWGGSE